ncbi:MAG: hypothetical protein R3C56_29455 [Pirellulaceae bacterium]
METGRTSELVARLNGIPKRVVRTSPVRVAVLVIAYPASVLPWAGKRRWFGGIVLALTLTLFPAG